MCSIVEYYGEFGKSSCGYCKGKRSSESAGMTAHFLSVEDYQDLIDRGWRRSGKYCYKPSNRTTCCPSYTIKCDVSQFVLSKSHKKILKTVNKFLRDGVKVKEEEKEESACSVDTGDHVPENNHPVETEYLKGATRDLPSIVHQMDEGVKSPVRKQNHESIKDAVEQPGGSPEKPPHGPQPKKKKLLRLEKRQAKLAAKGLPMDEQQQLGKKESGESSTRKSLEEFLNEEPKDGKHQLKVTLVPSNSPVAKASYDLYVKYQTSVHKDPPEKLTPEQFQRFLCISPLKPFETSSPNVTLGSFHQQYWLDDQLIAVAVIDLLPHCLSSVYFFYDPAYGFLSLGTYSSLREVAFVQQMQRELPDLCNYYMGFYIHSCPKMRYKAKLAASFLLCPEVYTWHRITEELLRRLDRSKYARFNEDAEAKDEDDVTQEDLKRIPMYNEGKPIPLEQYLRKCKDKTVFGKAHQYAKLVGRNCARRIVLYL